MATGVLIETNRLILRTVTLDDIDEVASSWRLDAGPISRGEAEGKIRWMLGNHAQNTPGRLTHLCLAVIEKEPKEWIGWCGLDNLDQA
jgi:RimJ/RimL family protein N-acetyltransferase